MKTYRIKVNGKTFEVTLESVSESKAAPAPVAEAKKEEPAPAPVTTGGAKVNAPIGGKVVAFKVNVGDVIKVGQIVAVIEAMKLENEVPSPVAGKVASIVAKIGNTVSNGDVLLTLE